jgi:hypothetical protein
MHQTVGFRAKKQRNARGEESRIIVDKLWKHLVNAGVPGSNSGQIYVWCGKIAFPVSLGLEALGVTIVGRR